MAAGSAWLDVILAGSQRRHLRVNRSMTNEPHLHSIGLLKIDFVIRSGLLQASGAGSPFNVYLLPCNAKPESAVESCTADVAVSY